MQTAFKYIYNVIVIHQIKGILKINLKCVVFLIKNVGECEVNCKVLKWNFDKVYKTQDSAESLC